MSISKTASSIFNQASSEDHKIEASADWALVQRIQAGDMDSFDPLIKKYRERLFSVVYNLTSNREDAADITQDAFIKAFRSISTFKGNAAFFTWLYKIAVNTAYNHLKKNRFKRFFSLESISEEGASQEVLEALSSKLDCEKSVFLNQLQEKLNEALQKLSIKHRTVVVLFEIEGLSHSEVAQVLGTSEGTVRSRLHYAKQELQTYLKDYIR